MLDTVTIWITFGGIVIALVAYIIYAIRKDAQKDLKKQFEDSEKEVVEALEKVKNETDDTVFTGNNINDWL